ncbi:protein kinase [[Kitasatospora] papulosa]|uniref:protein kinase domain-containing protein n=1 Tax=[Kitasatospora] papulosa TaxID=1464011 RepID=UPI003638DE98
MPHGREEAVARFKREAQAAARVDHPNISSVYDASYTDDTCCLVMQLVEGTTLEYLFDPQEGERFGVPSAVFVAAQLCAGLSAAHAAGLVHRDLKTRTSWSGGTGPSRSSNSVWSRCSPTVDPRLTMAGEGLGNIPCASPELLSGRVARWTGVATSTRWDACCTTCSSARRRFPPTSPHSSPLSI